MTEGLVPDLYELAFMPGQFRCPKCGFQWSIRTIDVAAERIGTTEENRETPDCPNDGTRMVHVTYREQLEAYADRLKEEFDKYDALKVATNKFLDYCEAHDWGFMPEPHDSVRDLLALLDRKIECHGDVNCATCGLPIACDGRHAEKQYCTERCEILDCASPKHPGCPKCEVRHEQP